MPLYFQCNWSFVMAVLLLSPAALYIGNRASWGGEENFISFSSTKTHLAYFKGGPGVPKNAAPNHHVYLLVKRVPALQCATNAMIKKPFN